jgi:hypothetical protein
LAQEFGKVGQGTVSQIKMRTKVEKKPEAPEKPKTMWDWLDQFQSLAGQALLALGVLLAVLVWKILPNKSNSNINQTGEVAAGSSGGGASTLGLGDKGHSETNDATSDVALEEGKKKENQSLLEEMEQFSNKINELVPRLLGQKDFENMIRTWCQLGESGKLRLAIFAEVVGKQVGRLPIPVDALSDITKIFNRMPGIEPREKRDALEKAYWDLLTTLNLGSDALVQPFGYLAGFNVGVISQALMDQNPKMKTLVSLFLPTELRSKYIRGLSQDTKRELLVSAASLSEVDASELKLMDSSLQLKVRPGSQSGDKVPLDMTLNKVIESLTPSEEVSLLAQVNGSSITEFKQTTPSLAFIGEWPDDPLTLLLSRATADELVAFLRVRGDLKDRILALSPPLTAEMAGDELARPDRLSEADRDGWLTSFSRRLKEMVQSQEIALDEIFVQPALKSNVEELPNASKSAA